MMRLLQKDTMAIVVDMQERMMPAIDQQDKVINHCALLIKGLLALDVPILVSRQYPKGLQDTVEPIKVLTEHCPVLDKIEFSCFGNESMREWIEQSGKKNIILMGVEAHICVLQTALDLQENHYRPIMVEDCLGSRTQENKDNGMKRAMQTGIIISNYESILFELLQKAGTETFKTISNLIK